MELKIKRKQSYVDYSRLKKLNFVTINLEFVKNIQELLYIAVKIMT